MALCCGMKLVVNMDMGNTHARPPGHPALCSPVVCQLLTELLPVPAGTQTHFVHPSDVLDHLLPLHSLGEGHCLGDICSYFRDILGL